jgi:hypothetical protein
MLRRGSAVSSPSAAAPSEAREREEPEHRRRGHRVQRGPARHVEDVRGEALLAGRRAREQLDEMITTSSTMRATETPSMLSSVRVVTRISL